MTKKYLFAVAVTAMVAIPSLFLLQKVKNNEVNKTEELRKKHASFLENSPFKKVHNLSKAERKSIGLPPNKFNEREWELTMDPNLGRPTPELAFTLNESLEKQRQQSNFGVPGSSESKWIERGPNNIGGRVRALLFDPNDRSNKRVIAAGVSGGIWTNDDITSASSSWKQVQGVPGNLSVTCITVDPNDSKTMYAGTGEVYTWGTINGNGVYKTTDGGKNWKHLFGGKEANLEDRIAFIQDIVAWKNPATGKTEVFFGVDSMIYIDGKTYPNKLGLNAIGLYRSTDGTTFTKVDLKEDDPIPANSFDIDSEGTLWMGSKAYYFTKKGGGKIFSTKDGATWTKAASEFENTGRVQLVCSKQTAGKAYILTEGLDANTPVKIYGTTDGFKTTTSKSLPNDADTGIPSNDFTRNQNFYNLEIAIDPKNDETLYVGGIDLFKSTNGGGKWSQLSHWYGGFGFQNVHADQHAIAFANDSSSKMIFGNDGGIFYSSDAGKKIEMRNKDLNITQFYWSNISKHNSKDNMIAGAQDNGSIYIIDGSKTSPSSGTDIAGGDGGYCFIDDEGKYIISSYVYNNYKYHNYSNGQEVYALDNDSDRNQLRDGDFINQATLDSKNDILYANGTSGEKFQIYAYKLGASNDTRTVLSNDLLTKPAIAFKVSPFDASKLFAGTVDGKVLRIDGANGSSQTWTELTQPGSVGSVSSIEFGETENDIFVTFHNWGIVSIYASEDGGKTWKNKEGNLPNIPVKCILQNPLLPNEVIIGTELGVWVTSNFKADNPTWVQSYNGMRDVKVMSFDLRKSDNTILATTFGRGLFTGKFNDKAMTVNENKLVTGGVTVFPTVSNGEFNITSKVFDGAATVNVYTITGKRVYSASLNFKANKSETLNLSGNAPGMYLVNVTGGNSKLTKKIIIK